MISRRAARDLILGPGRGKRYAEREGRRLTERVRELDAAGFSEKTIASATGLPVARVREVLGEGVR